MSRDNPTPTRTVVIDSVTQAWDILRRTLAEESVEHVNPEVGRRIADDIDARIEEEIFTTVTGRRPSEPEIQNLPPDSRTISARTISELLAESYYRVTAEYGDLERSTYSWWRSTPETPISGDAFESAARSLFTSASLFQPIPTPYGMILSVADTQPERRCPCRRHSPRRQLELFS